MKATITFEGMKEFLEAEVKRQLTALIPNPETHTLEERIHTLEEQLEELSDVVGRINDTLGEHRNDLIDLNRMMEDFDIDKMTERVRTLEEDFGDLDSRVDDAESSIESIERDYITSDDFDFESYIHTVDRLEDKVDEIEKIGPEVDITKYEDDISNMIKNYIANRIMITVVQS